ncbi:MAG: SurA N-terminal domain-containing protein [Pirellulales bacterium]|nr:SurA N-terminal domain-containing protein [Pirellulales bacterium]
MASPFKVFRKHQKGLIAFFGLAAMIAFVFLSGPVLDTIMSRANRDRVLVKTTRFGNLRASQVATLRQQRQKVLSFLNDVVQSLNRSEGGKGDAARAAIRQIGEPTEQGVVTTWLLAQEASQLGIVISDAAINAFIAEVTEDRVHSTELVRILQKRSVSQRHLFELLRHELLALRLQGMFEASVWGATPAQRWEYFNRLERQAAIEVAAVPVARYVHKVSDPGDDALRKFFEKYKGQLYDPASPEPGFRQPHRVAIRYFQADYEKFTGAALISDEEVLNRYEQNKDEYDRRFEGYEPTPTTQDTSQPTESQPTESQDQPSGDAEGQTPTAPKQGPAASEEDPLKTETGPEAPTQDVESNEKEAAPADPTPGEPGNIDGASSSRRASPFVLTSMLQEKSPEAGGEPAEAETPPVADAQTPTAEEGTPAAETETPPAETEVPAGEAEMPAAGPAVPGPETGAADQPADAAQQPEEALQEPVAEPPKPAVDQKAPPQPKTPEEILKGPIGDAIRRELANEKMDQIFGALQTQLKKYNESRILHDADPEQHGKPADLDCDLLATQNGLVTEATGLISELDAQDLDIGKSFVDYRTRFPAYAFQRDWQEYSSAMSISLADDLLPKSRYLFWKTEDIGAKTPEFEDKGVREQVLGAWKMVEARKFAEEEAERLAKEARASGKPLQEALADQPDVTVTSTPPFSWMTYGSVPEGSSRTAPRLSEVEGVELRGPDFMAAVFALKTGEVGVAMNRPQTIAYVIRVTSTSPSENLLRTKFESDRYGTYMVLAGEDQNRIFRQWLEEIRLAAGLEWIEPPVTNVEDE